MGAHQLDERDEGGWWDVHRVYARATDTPEHPGGMCLPQQSHRHTAENLGNQARTVVALRAQHGDTREARRRISRAPGARVGRLLEQRGCRRAAARTGTAVVAVLALSGCVPGSWPPAPSDPAPTVPVSAERGA